MAFWLVAGFAVVLFAWFEYSLRRHRRRLLTTFRAEWGHPLEKTRRVDTIAAYHETLATAAERPIDERTAQDLDLDAVFAVLDRTVCSVGQQLLYHRLRTTPTPDDLGSFEALMTRFGQDVPDRERIQQALVGLRGHSGDAWWLTQPNVLDIRRGDVIFPLLAPIVPVALLLSVVWPQAVVVAFAGMVVNATVRYRSANRLVPALQHFRQVGPLIASAKRLCATIRACHPTRGDRLATDLRALARLSRHTAVVSRDPRASDDLSAAIFEIINTIFLLDVNALYFAVKALEANRLELLRTFAAVGTVDAALGVASYRAGTAGWSRPVLQLGPESSKMVALRHPLLAGAIPNSIELGPPHGVLVTGSNMSGKSTFLRTVGVNVLLAQTVNTCIAAEYRAARFEVRSVIGRSDDMVAGRSYYKDEVEAIIALVHATKSSSPHLLLFDELFRGTSTVERIAAAEATLAELVNGEHHDGPHTPHVVIAATHDRELVDLMGDSYVSYHFSDTVDANGLSFDYCLREGPAQSWNAIALLEVCGAPQRLVRRALASTTGLGHQRRLPEG